MRRWLSLALLAAALAFIVVTERLPVLSAPRVDWFPAGTPAVCAAVDSLRTAGASRVSETPALPRSRADKIAAQTFATHYDTPASIGVPLLVRLPPVDAPAYVYPAQIGEAAALLTLDAATGAPRALVTALHPSRDCPPDPLYQPLVIGRWLALGGMAAAAALLLRRPAALRAAHSGFSVW